MPEESPDLPTSRVARWLAIGLVILIGVLLYFSDGRRVVPLLAPPAAGEPAP